MDKIDTHTRSVDIRTYTLKIERLSYGWSYTYVASCLLRKIGAINLRTNPDIINKDNLKSTASLSEKSNLHTGLPREKACNRGLSYMVSLS